MDDTTATESRHVGAVLVEKSLITAAELERALQLQESTGASLGEIVAAEFGVSQADLQHVLAERRSELGRAVPASPPASSPREQAFEPEPLTPAVVKIRRPIGEIFVELGFIDNEQLLAALAVQRRTGARLGEILVEQGSLTRLDLASALAEHWESGQSAPAAGGQPSRSGPPVAPPAEPRWAVENRAGLAELEQRLQSVEDRLESEPQARPRWRRRRLAGTADDGAVQARIDQLAARLGDLEGTIAELGSSLERLSAARVSDSIVTGARLAEVEAAIESPPGLEVRALEGVQRDLAGRSEAMAERLDDVENRLDALAVLEERVVALADAATALRVEPHVLAERPASAAPGEQPGDLAEELLADVRLLGNGSTRRSDGETARAPGEQPGEQRDQVAATGSEGWIAFAPTAAGYRLVELPGRPPELGATVELGVDGCEGPLVVSRYGRSPLPFDRRPCAFLDRD